MKRFTSILLCAILISAISASVNISEQPKDVLQSALDQYHKTIRASHDEDDSQEQDFASFQQTLGTTKYMCTNGINPTTLSKKNYLAEFKKGPCNPAIVLPGIGGSKLIIEIDCPKFKAYNPAAFTACGWVRCIGLQSPNNEYKVWIPTAISPMSIYLDTDNARNCFNAVFGFDTSKISSGTIKPVPGIAIKPEGTSNETKLKKDSNCASIAIEDLQTTGGQINGTDYFKKFREAFENAGYITGLTYQALPYDFRLSYQENELNTRFKGIIKELNDNWGKKVVIFAHSFGNLQTVHNLVKMSQADKDNMIARYIGLAPPYLGSPKTVEGQIGLDNTFSQDLGFAQVGITPSMYRHTVGIMKGLFNLMPKDTFKRLASTDWMKAVYQRIDAERRGRKVTTNTVVDLLPQPNEQCMPGFSSRDAFCSQGLVDFSQFGTIEGDPITVSTLEKVFKKYAVVESSDAVWKSVQDNLFDDLTNTGVQTNVMYTTTLKTMYHFEFEENPKVKTDNNQYVASVNNQYQYGDGTVLSTSSLIAGLKWADDFKNKKAGAKPTTMIEVCSTYQRRTSVFNTGTLDVSDNAYFGMECDCAGTQWFPNDGKKCGHTNFLTDAKVIKFLLQSAADGVAAVETSASRAFADKSEEQLAAYENNCQLINSN